MSNRAAPIPMIHLGATRYLLMAHFQLTSFGTRFVIDNTFVRNGRFVDDAISTGQTIGARTWGVGLQGTRLASIRQWTVDGEGTVWHREDWGEEFKATAYRALARRGPRAIALAVQAGFKTDGFVAGDRA